MLFLLNTCFSLYLMGEEEEGEGVDQQCNFPPLFTGKLAKPCWYIESEGPDAPALTSVLWCVLLP